MKDMMIGHDDEFVISFSLDYINSLVLSPFRHKISWRIYTVLGLKVNVTEFSSGWIEL